MKKLGLLFLSLLLLVGFVGCKVEPEEKAELTKIEITAEPEKKEYFTGETLDLTGLKVTATYSDKTTADVTKDVKTNGFDSSAAAESQTVTVTYGGKTASFTVKIKQGYLFHDTVKVLEPGTNGSFGTSATYVEFGDWPQDVVPAADVETLGLETSTTKITRGYMEYVLGNDANYYVKCVEKLNSDSMSVKKYFDGSDINAYDEENPSYRWFKVMPIKWCIADSAYDIDGKEEGKDATGKLLLSDLVLTSEIPYYEDKDNVRTIGNDTVYSNNYMHSQIRAYLNGISYQGPEAEETKWNGKGFFQTAFGKTAQEIILPTLVDNSEASTNQSPNLCVCADTEDKVFLLSAQESGNLSHSLLKKVTDYALATGISYVSGSGYGGTFLFRSPHYDRYASGNQKFVDFINPRGSFVYNSVDYQIGILPAVVIPD